MDSKQEPKPEVQKSEIQLVREEMNSLQQHPGWRRIVRFLQKKIDFHQLQLNEGTGDNETIEDVKLTRAKKNITEQLMNLPDILATMMEKAQGEDINLDPYDQTTQIDINNFGQ